MKDNVVVLHGVSQKGRSRNYSKTSPISPIQEKIAVNDKAAGCVSISSALLGAQKFGQKCFTEM